MSVPNTNSQLLRRAGGCFSDSGRPRFPPFSKALLDVEEYFHVGSILRKCGRIAPYFELVREQRGKAHNVGSNAKEHCDVVAECTQGPVASTMSDRSVDNAIHVSSEEREIEACCSKYVLGVTVLVGLGRVMPASLSEQFVNAVEVVDPDRDVDICVRSRHPTRVEVDRPTAEHPIIDPLPPEQLVQSSEYHELGFVVAVGAHHGAQYDDPSSPSWRPRTVCRLPGSIF